MNVYWGAGVSAVFFMGVAWFTATFLKLEGPMFALFFGMLSTIGITASAFYAWMQQKHAKHREQAAAQASSGGPAAGASAAPAQGGGDAEVVIREADQRLAASRLAQGASISNLPLVFVLGDNGTAKTSTMTASGVEPELLAGQVYQDSTTVPTRGVNVWFARQTTFVEPGGRFMQDPQSWVSLIKRLTPGKLKSVVGAKAQAPRGAILCVSCEDLMKPGATEAMTVTARRLHDRLGEVAQTLGISFPVYVLFTKMDRVPFLLDFVRNLSNEEAAQVLGITLPIRPQQSSGVFGEEETRRLTNAFDSLFHSFCDKRIEFLPRENDPDKLPGAYEFPREFRKLRTTMVQFLVDVCRPSQLRANPFLRGFYFSGVRPVTVSDTPVAPVRMSQPSGGGDAGATRMFNVGSMTGAAAPAYAQSVGSKRVPQWMFLGHLFNDVILADKAAMGLSGSSSKTSGVQRILLIAAAALALIFTGIFTWSFFSNRSMEQDAIQAAQGIPSTEGAGGALPSVDALQRLETLRQSLERLTHYRQQGAPFGMRWGLFAGDDMYPHVRRTYYSRYHQLIFGETQAGMLEYLRRLPSAPGAADPYEPPYNTLKGYLITTSHPDKSTKQFLSPLLLGKWSDAHKDIGSERMKLAQLQFDFYSEDLPRGNPFSSDDDDLAVDRARRYLNSFTGYERVYNFMLGEASSKNKKVNFNADFPGTAPVVLNGKDVPGAFTKEGWATMQDSIKNADRFFAGEKWVLGDYAQQRPDLAKLEAELRARYTTDYIKRWQEYVKISRVVPYANLKDASEKLGLQTSNQSPLLALLWVGTRHTSVENPDVKQAFDALHKVVTPPATTTQYVLPSNQQYVNALISLQTSIETAAGQQPLDPATAQQTLQQASQARLNVRQMANTFVVDNQAKLHTEVQRLLDEPITQAEALLKGAGVSELNGAGKALCAQFAGMTRKFPFNPTAQEEATLPEVNGLLLPGTGKLWTFHAEKLKPVLVEQGGQYVQNPAPGAVQLTPGFITFFNQAARFSKALYAGGSTEPRLAYTLQPLRSDQISELQLNIDGKTLKYPGQNTQQFIWPGTSVREANVKIKMAGSNDFLDANTFPGLWAVFRFFADAERLTASGSGYNLEWVVRTGRSGQALMYKGAPVNYRFFLDLAGAPPVFSKEWLSSFRCVAQVAR